jgi:hypothetical protein
VIDGDDRDALRFPNWSAHFPAVARIKARLILFECGAMTVVVPQLAHGGDDGWNSGGDGWNSSDMTLAP